MKPKVLIMDEVLSCTMMSERELYLMLIIPSSETKKTIGFCRYSKQSSQCHRSKGLSFKRNSNKTSKDTTTAADLRFTCSKGTCEQDSCRLHVSYMDNWSMYLFPFSTVHFLSKLKFHLMYETAWFLHQGIYRAASLMIGFFLIQTWFKLQYWAVGPISRLIITCFSFLSPLWINSCNVSKSITQ